MPTARPIRVAIIGGGLAGLALANALVRRPNPQDTAPDHPGFDVQVFEAKPVLSERGAAVGLGQGARIALKYCIPDADDMLQRAGAVPQAGTQMMVGSGKHAGAAIIALGSAVKPISNIDSEPQDKPAPEKEAPNTGGPVVVHRPSLLHGLKQSLEEGSKANRTIHTSKRLASIQIGDGEEVTITFEDGCVDKFDAVIGADGYRGAVRSHVLGDKAETQAVLQSGFWDCRNMVSMDVAKELFYKPLREALRSRATTAEERATVDDYFGEGDSFDRHSQWGWAGDTGFVMHDVCENGTKVQCVIAAVEKTPWKERKYPLTRDFVREHLEGWMDGPVLPAMLDVMFYKEEENKLFGYNEWHHEKTSTYNSGRVCIMGDAAHATTPWQGSGAAMAFEDAMILSHLLWNTASVDHLGAAFEAFTEVRIDRCQHIIDSSAGTGRIICGQNPEVGEVNAETRFFDVEPPKTRAALAHRWDRIHGLKSDEHRDEARALLEKKIKKNESH